MKDEAVEAWLTELEIAWQYVDELDLGNVDTKASLRNQARLEAINDETLERYTEDMRRGDVFPPILVRARPNGTYVVLGGNHRYKAAVAAKAALSAYIVECSDETALRLSYEDNRRHGLPPSEAERVRQAQHLVAALNWSTVAAARVVGITPNKLQRAILATEFVTRCRRLGMYPPEHLVETTKSRLMNLRADPVFVDAVHLVDDADLPGDDVYRIVTALNAARSEAEATEMVRNERAIAADRIQRKLAGNTKRTHGETARVRLLRLTTEIVQLQPGAVALATLPDQRRDLFSQLRRAMEHLALIDTTVRKS